MSWLKLINNKQIDLKWNFVLLSLEFFAGSELWDSILKLQQTHSAKGLTCKCGDASPRGLTLNCTEFCDFPEIFTQISESYVEPLSMPVTKSTN